jgi:transcriptional regulator with XRE-family HTH domain
MKSTLKLKNCLGEIKKRLKEKRITYQQIADNLGVSLLTIKRQLNADDIAFVKLVSLCDAAGLSLTEILSDIEDTKVQHTSFTEEQDLAFCENECLFHYFAELFFNKKSPQKIQSEYHLTQVSTHRYLRKLEDIGLISLSVKGNASLLVEAPIGFVESTQFVFKEIENSLKVVAGRLSKASQFNDFVVVKPLTLPTELKEQMCKEIADIVSNYAELSERFYQMSDYPSSSLVVCAYNNKNINNSPMIKNFA